MVKLLYKEPGEMRNQLGKLVSDLGQLPDPCSSPDALRANMGPLRGILFQVRTALSLHRDHFGDFSVSSCASLLYICAESIDQVETRMAAVDSIAEEEHTASANLLAEARSSIFTAAQCFEVFE